MLSVGGGSVPDFQGPDSCERVRGSHGPCARFRRRTTRALTLVNTSSRRGVEQAGPAPQALRDAGVELVRSQPEGAEGIGAAIRAHSGR